VPGDYGAGQHQRCYDDPGHRAGGLQPFGTPWLFDRSLILAGAVTALAVLALFLMFRGETVAGQRLSWASLRYLHFAGAPARARMSN
jgi:hypothetical protein